MACGRLWIGRVGLEREAASNVGCPSLKPFKRTAVELLTTFVVAVTALLGLASAPASAKEIHQFSTSFGVPASDTTLSLTTQSGLGVNETSHAIYIADTGNRRIVELSATGEFIRAFGADVGGLGVDVCTSGCQAGTAGTSPGSFESPTFIAIDNSGGASNGDIYVADSATHLVSKFEADGTLVSSWGSGGQLDGSSAPGGPFAEIAGLAVGPSGELAVFEVEPQKLFTFEEDASFIAEVETPRGTAALGLSLDGDGNFFKVNGDQTVQKFAPSGASIGQITGGGAGPATGLSANPVSGVLYVDLGESINAYEFNGAGEVVNPAGSCAPEEFTGCPESGSFGEGDLALGRALATDGSDDTVYAADVAGSSIAVFTAVTIPDVTTGLAEVHSTTTATLNGEVNPDEIALEECFFEYGETTDYGAAVSCEEPDAEEVGTGNSFVPVQADLTGLTPGRTYHYRLVAANENGTNDESGDQEFFTGASIISTFASAVSATAATLNTEINPNGVMTTYRFQYVSDSAFALSGYATAAEVPAGGETIGSGTSPVSRSLQLQGLAPSTTYHFRVVAENSLGTVEGPDRTFTTQPAGLGFLLPDGRVWEMVSPSDKHGARIVGGGEIHLQASAEGNGLAYQSYLSTEADPEGNRIIESSMNLARRQADGSWRSKDITPPNDEVTRLAVGQGTEYKFFNSDLSKAIVDPRSGTLLSPEASERTPYLRENTEPPFYTPLVTGKEPFANVPPGTEFGGGQDATGFVQVVAASPDFRHFGLRTKRVPLVEGAPAFGETLYEWSDGRIEPVSVLPPNEGGAIVTAQLIGSGFGSVDGALSTDGSRVFWSAGSPTALYLRYNATEAPSAISDDGEDSICTEPEKACTVRIDVKQSGATGLGAPRPVFQGASADGTVIFFTDSQQLAENASPDGADLYRCELPAANAAAGCASLTDLSVPTGAGENAEVQGIAAAVTDDGTKIYFVARGVLDATPNQLGESALSGHPSLYVWQQGEGVRFIARLSDEDRTDWGQESASSSAGIAGVLTASASPSGRYLGFMSQRSLTGYDNRDESSGEPAQEVFRYDSATDQLRCVSCHPTGQKPHSAIPSQVYRAFVDPFKLWEGRPVAAALPEATVTTGLSGGGVSLYRPRAVLDNGRVFFNAIDALVPADSNGEWDVYQYESTGVGDCSASSGGASIARLSDGCSSLISSGTAGKEAAFLDADETGDNAFFFTPAQLSALDEDHEVDIYDARVGGIAATRPSDSECLFEACRPAGQAPGVSLPASSAFNGAGNVKPVRRHCGKGKRRVRRKGKVRCVPRKHRHHGSKSRGAHR